MSNERSSLMDNNEKTASAADASGSKRVTLIRTLADIICLITVITFFVLIELGRISLSGYSIFVIAAAIAIPVFFRAYDSLKEYSSRGKTRSAICAFMLSLFIAAIAAILFIIDAVDSQA